jgi:hypothetical protein
MPGRVRGDGPGVIEIKEVGAGMEGVMFDFALLEIFLLSLSMVGALRLFEIVFLGDLQRGPAIGGICRTIADGFKMKGRRLRPASDAPVKPNGSVSPGPGRLC